VVGLALLALTLAGSARPAAPGLSAAPIQNSPVLVRTGRGGGIAFGGGRVWVSVYDLAYAVELDPLTGALLGAVHTGAKPRDAVVAGQTLWVVDEAAGKLTPIPLGPRQR